MPFSAGAASSRNEPLLPRSASFSGSRNVFDPLMKLRQLVLNIRHACEGDIVAMKGACVLAVCATLAVGLMTLMSPFTVLSPLHLLTCLYLVPLSLVALALEVGDGIVLLEPFRQWVQAWVAALTVLEGRGVMYVILGTLVAGMGDPLSLVAGLLDISAGFACICASRPVSKQDEDEARSVEGRTGSSGSGAGFPVDETSLPRLAFRRRVLFGMERMDSAELVSLCLELGLRLEPRARASALAQLDPEGMGSIDEEAFIAWWEQQQRQQLPQLPSRLHAAPADEWQDH